MPRPPPPSSCSLSDSSSFSAASSSSSLSSFPFRHCPDEPEALASKDTSPTPLPLGALVATNLHSLFLSRPSSSSPSFSSSSSFSLLALLYASSSFSFSFPYSFSLTNTSRSIRSIHSRSSRIPYLLLFFTILTLDCCLDTSSFYSHAARNINSNQRVDAPSPDDFPPLDGPDFAFTSKTPLGALDHPREYADGALATQKLIAAPLIPIDRQLWAGVDTRTSYFGNNYGVGKISKVPELLQAGMRRLVLDLYWDGTDLGWQLCPRYKRDGARLPSLRLALEQETHQGNSQERLELQGMGEHPPTHPSGESSPLKDGMGFHADGHQASTVQDHAKLFSAKAHPKKDPSSTTTTNKNQKSSAEDPHQKRDRSGPEHNRPKGHDSTHPLEKAREQLPDSKAQDSKGRYQTQGKEGIESRKHPKDWFSKKRRRPRINPKAMAIGLDKDKERNHHRNHSSAKPNAINRSAVTPNHRASLHRLAMSKGMVSAYNRAEASDQTVDGITCSSGEDLVILLQSLQTWIQQSTEDELEDVMLLILNLNELGSQSLGNPAPPQPPPPPAPSPSVNGTEAGAAAGVIDNKQFFASLFSPNTNQTIKAILPNMISLKELFLDAFPSLIYSPHHLAMDREDLDSSWWRTGRVGLDYYNTTEDPNGRMRTETGWPTSFYLTETIKRRIVVGIGANHLRANTSYNITDDYTTFYDPGTLGVSMTNSSLIKISSSLNQDLCDFPLPGMMMEPTGTEENLTTFEAQKKNSSNLADITTRVSWSFSSMSDSDLSPWSFLTGQLATTCGYSALVEGRSSSLSFSEQAAMSIWSWDLNQPPNDDMRSRDRRCGAMQSNGRWAVQDCNKKLPVACRQEGTSAKWLIYDKGASNYRDVQCPVGYKFDLPRTARENQELHATLMSYWNVTSPAFYQSLVTQQKLHRQTLELALQNPAHLKKRHYEDDDKDDREEDGEEDEGSDEDDKDEDDEEEKSRRHSRSKTVEHAGHPLGGANRAGLTAKEVAAPPIRPVPDVGGGPGMIWIDISSWQTAGCWVPGGPHGICPYQAPDNTVALQEIIKVSSIGGVIILVLVGMFLYLKCRRNVRLRKANKRRANVRNKIMRTEVETVPA